MKNKFILLVIVSAFLVLATCSPVFADTMYVTSEIGLNIRRTPGLDGTIVGILDYGEEVEVVKVLDGLRNGKKWAYIRCGGHIRACCADLLSETDPELQTQEEQSTHLYANCRITHYCHCAQCCGVAGGNCASGVQPTVGRTVANGSLPFGTRVLINGHEYVVEDRGVGAYEFDIFVSGHQEAWDLGEYWTDVYIID